MKINTDGLNLIKSCEGLRLTAYQDIGGVWTIGYGLTGNVHEGQTCTEEQANQWLLERVSEFEHGVDALLRRVVNENQFSALVSFAYNLGLGTLQRSTLLTYLNSGDFENAANEFLRWSHVGGKLVPGLLRRREAERALFLKAVV